MDDRFAFGPELGPEPMEEGRERGGNRVFLIMAIGLVGLILLGGLGIGYYFIQLKPQQEKDRAAKMTQAVAELTVVAQATEMAPTDTPLPTHTPVPTNTPIPTPTPRATDTRVLPVADTPAPGSTATPTRTPVGGSQTPQTGIGGLGAVLAAVGLVALILVARKLRLAT